MKRACSASKRSSKSTTTDYRQRIQNYKQDIDTLKNQVSQLYQKIADSDESSTNSSNIPIRNVSKKTPASKHSPKSNVNKKIIDFDNVDEKEGNNSLVKRYNRAAAEVERLKKIISNNDFRFSQITEENKILKQQIVELKASKSANPSEFLQIQSDNRILAKKMKLLISDMSKLEQENKQMKDNIVSYIEQNKELKSKIEKSKKNRSGSQSNSKTVKSTSSKPFSRPKPNQKATKTETEEINTEQLNEEIRLDAFQTNEKYAEKIEILTKENQQLKTVVIKCHSLLKENQRLKEQIEKLNKDINHIINTRVDPTEAVNLANQVQELNNEKKVLLAKLNQTANSLKTLQNTKPRQIDSEAIATLTEKVSTLNQENMDLKSATLTNTLNKNELKKLQKKLKMTKQKARPFDSETIADLTEKIASLAQENMVLRMNSLQQTNSISDENEKLKKAVMLLQKKSSILSSDSEAIASLAEKIAALTEENNSLKSKNIASKSLKREYNNVKEKLNEVIETVRKSKLRTNATNEELKIVKNLNEKINEILEKKQQDDDTDNHDDFNSSSSSVKRSSINDASSSDSLKSELNAAQETIKQMKDDFSKQKSEMKKHFETLLNDVKNNCNDNDNDNNNYNNNYNENEYNNEINNGFNIGKNGNDENSTKQMISSLENQLDEQKKRYNSLYDLYQKLQSQFDRTRHNNQILISELESSKGVEVNLINKYLREENEDLKEKLEKLKSISKKENEKSLKKLKASKINEFSDLFNNIYKSIGEVTDENKPISDKLSSSSLSIIGNDDEDFEKLKKLVSLDDNSALDSNINKNNINIRNDDDCNKNLINNDKTNDNDFYHQNIEIDSDKENVDNREIIFDLKINSNIESDQESSKYKEDALENISSISSTNERNQKECQDIKNIVINEDIKNDEENDDNDDNIEEFILKDFITENKDAENDDIDIEEEEIQKILQQQSDTLIKNNKQNLKKPSKNTDNFIFPFEPNSGLERFAGISSGNTSDAFAAITRDIDLGSDGDYSNNFQFLLEEKNSKEDEPKD